MLPVIGPATTRGIPGMVFDTVTNPATYAPVPIRSLELLNERAKAGGKLKIIKEKNSRSGVIGTVLVHLLLLLMFYV